MTASPSRCSVTQVGEQHGAKVDPIGLETIGELGPDAGGLELPFVNLNGIVDNVNVLVANEINKLIAGVGSALPTHKPTLQKIVLGQGYLEATFSVTIGAPTTQASTPAATTAPATTVAVTPAPATTAPTK